MVLLKLGTRPSRDMHQVTHEGPTSTHTIQDQKHTPAKAPCLPQSPGDSDSVHPTFPIHILQEGDEHSRVFIFTTFYSVDPLNLNLPQKEHVQLPLVS